MTPRLGSSHPKVLGVILAATLVLSALVATSATAGGPPPPSGPPPVNIAPRTDVMKSVLKKGQPIVCGMSEGDDEEEVFLPCDSLTAELTVSKPVARFLGLKSRVIATGTTTGPTSERFDRRLYEGVFRLPILPSVVKKLKKKDVVHMAVEMTAEATLEGYADGIWPDDPDYWPLVYFSQGYEYGCDRPVKGDPELVTGCRHL